MDTHLSIFVALVPCPRCAGRNAVDVRKALRRRSRCGRCGTPLPLRVPVPVLVAAGTILIIGLAVAYALAGAWLSHQAEGSREEIVRLLEVNEPAEAVHLLESPRTPSSESGRLALLVAEALARPVLEADRDASLGRAALDQAVERADALVARYGSTLPELLAVLDAPVARLQARLGARDLLAGADKLASAAVPNLDAVERALATARLASTDAPGDVAGAVDELSIEIRARAALRAAQSVVARRPDEAMAHLRGAAKGILLPQVEGSGIEVEPPQDVASLALLDQLAAIRQAVGARDAARLRGLVRLRPAAGWSASASDEFATELVRACRALASLEADAARTSFEPEERADHLLAAMTCDEMLPAEFLVAGRMALADAFVDRARRGGALRPALGAWSAIHRPERDRALAAIGCLAEARADWSDAVVAWSLVESRSVLRLLADCRLEAREEAIPLPLPSLDYPSLPGAP